MGDVLRYRRYPGCGLYFEHDTQTHLEHAACVGMQWQSALGTLAAVVARLTPEVAVTTALPATTTLASQCDPCARLCPKSLRMTADPYMDTNSSILPPLLNMNRVQRAVLHTSGG